MIKNESYISLRATFRLLAVALLVALATACGGPAKFRIKGDTADRKELTLRLVVYSVDGVSNHVLATRDGHFEFTGVVPEGEQPVFIEIYSHDYKLLGLAMANADSELEMTIDPAGLKGYRVTDAADQSPESFGAVLDEWLSKVSTVDNASVERFVSSHTSSPAALAVLSTVYDASVDGNRARKLYASLKPTAIFPFYDNGFATLINRIDEVPEKIEPARLLCAADTFFTLDPSKYKGGTLIVFTLDNDARTDSVVPMLQRLGAGASSRRRLIVEHNLTPDTSAWRRALRSDLRTFSQINNTEGAERVNEDKVQWISVWSGVGPVAPFADRFDISALPYFVVADSAAVVRYAGTSAAKARHTLDNLNRKK